MFNLIYWILSYRMCDEIATIDGNGGEIVDSLNVGVATGVLLNSLLGGKV